MLKKIILLIFVAIPAICKPIDFYILGGLNLSTYQYDSNFGKGDYFTKNPRNDWGTSWQIGVESEVELSSIFNIFFGIQYQSRKMSTGNIYLLDYSSSYPLSSKDHRGYLAMPMGIKLEIKNYPYFSIGGENLLLVHASRISCVQSNCQKFNNVGEAYNKFAFALLLGVGYEFQWQKSNVSLEIRWSNGLTSKFKEKYEFLGSNAVENSIQFFLKIPISM